MYQKYFKRLIDVLIAVVVLTLFLPVLVILMIVLSISFKANPFFTQLRPGKDERIFKLFKLKSMNNKRDSSGELLPDNQRLTFVGKLVRKSSLDELPQLINVLKGDMSLIGPRPLLVKYLPYYNEREKLRHKVRPGITGWAQVNGRNLLDWEERLSLDAYYVENVSFKLDMLIVMKTIANMVRGKDIIVDPRSSILDFDHARMLTLNQAPVNGDKF